MSAAGHPRTAEPTGPVARGLLPLTAEFAPDGHLRIGGLDVVELADEHGTPLFLYDEAHLRGKLPRRAGRVG